MSRDTPSYDWEDFLWLIKPREGHYTFKKKWEESLRRFLWKIWFDKVKISEQIVEKNIDFLLIFGSWINWISDIWNIKDSDDFHMIWIYWKDSIDELKWNKEISKRIKDWNILVFFVCEDWWCNISWKIEKVVLFEQRNDDNNNLSSLRKEIRGRAFKEIPPGFI